MEIAKETTYTQARKEAYERNREKIQARESEKKRWISYYAENKEKIAERRKAKRATQEKKPIDEAKVKRYEELLEEMETLKKEVALKRLRETLAKKKAPAPAPAPVDPPALPATITMCVSS
jgi:hypothetical protein